MKMRLSDLSPEQFGRVVQHRRVERMAKIDSQPPDIRQLVHEYGWHVVNSFQKHGVTKPRIIRHLVETVLDEFSPTRGSSSAQGARSYRDGFGVPLDAGRAVSDGE